MKALLVLLLVSSNTFARWATKSDLEYSLDKEISEYKVKADGSYTLIQTMEYEILKDSARNRFSIYKVPYSSSSAKVKILEASVTNGTQTTQVPNDKIVDRSMTVSHGISDKKEIQVALPNLHLNSKIRIKYEMSVEKVTVQGHFSMSHRIGEIGQANESLTQIESEKPLFTFINDPDHVIEYKSENLGKKYHYSFRLRAPYMKRTVEEMGIPPQGKIAYYKFSTDKDWSVIGQSLMKSFENVLSQEIPKEFSPVLEEVKSFVSLEDKVNHMVAYVTQHLNYMGDWRTVAGQFSPRNLKEVAQTKYGDCKDFASLLAVLLRKQGYKADVALVLRSNMAVAHTLTHEVPTIDSFNHAIVRLQDGQKTYWIDPTNKTSFALNHRNDIALSKALALDGKFNLEQIPAENVSPNRLAIHKTITFENSNAGEMEGVIELNGEFALGFTGIEQGLSKEKITEGFLKLASHGEKVLVPTVGPYDLSSKKFTPIRINLKYAASDLSFEENGQTHAKLPNMGAFFRALHYDLSRWEGDLFLGDLLTFERSLFLKGVYAQKRPKGCSLSTEWVDIDKKFEFNKDGTILREKFIVHKNFIPAHKFKSTDFILLQSELGSCLAGSFITFDFNNKKHGESEEEINAKFAGLPLKERVEKRYEFANGIFTEEIKSNLSYEGLPYFLRKNIDEDPKHIQSYRLLSAIILRAGYYNGDNYNRANVIEAQRVLAKGLKENPGNITLVLRYLETAYYLKDMDSVHKMMAAIKPESISQTHDMLVFGYMFNRLKDKDKAIHFFNEAGKMAKTKLEREATWFRKASFYYGVRDYEKCVSSYDEVLKINPEDKYTHINVIQCLIGLNRFDEAVNRGRKGLLVTQAGMMRSQMADALVNRGYSYLTNGRIEPAEKDFKEALQYRTEAHTYGYLATVASKKGDFERAFAYLVEGGKHSEKDLGEFYVNFQTVFDSAPEYKIKLMNLSFEQSTKVQNKLWAQYYIGYTLQNMGKTEELKAHLVKAREYIKTVNVEAARKKSVSMAIMNIQMLEMQAAPGKGMIIRMPASTKSSE